MVTANKTALAELPSHRRDALRRSLTEFFDRGRPRVVRSFVQFSVEAIKVGEGRAGGDYFNFDEQPFARCILEEFDNPYWTRHVGYGCVQSGKTLLYVVIPAARTLFELGENFGVGVPQMETAADKWRDDLGKSFELSFPNETPTGAGSKGAKKLEAITFKNRKTLKFLSGQGKSEKRAGVTLQFISVTEADKVDRPPVKTSDPNPIGEIEGRNASFGDDAKFWGECTVTTKKGWVHRERRAGSEGEIVKPCPHCRQGVVPGRKNLVGWEAAPDELTARENAMWACPNCGEEITETERRAMCQLSRAVHRGQRAEFDEQGNFVVVGPLPRTRTCGMRWSAFDNLFWTTEFIASKCWRAANPTDEQDEESTEKWVCQYMFADPWEEEAFDLMPLTIEELKQRITHKVGIARVPKNTFFLSCGMDVRQSQLHFVARAWMRNEYNDLQVVESSAFDVGTMAVDAKNLGLRTGLLDALRRFRDQKILPGYFDDEGQKFAIGWTLVDMGWQERIIWEFMLENAELGIPGFAPIIGRGQSEPPGKGSYSHPDEVKGNVLWIGEECHLRRSSKYAGMFAEAGAESDPMYVIANSDEWKSFVRYGFLTPTGQEGALTTFDPASAEDHRLLGEYRKQLKAETVVRKHVPLRGVVEVHVNSSRRQNHFGDCDYYSCVAGHLGGVRIVVKRRDLVRPVVVPESNNLTMPDGRSFLAV